MTRDEEVERWEREVEHARNSVSTLEDLKVQLSQTGDRRVNFLLTRLERYARMAKARTKLNYDDSFWQECGLDGALLRSTTEAIEALTLFQVDVSALPALISYAKHIEATNALDVLFFLLEHKISSAAEVIGLRHQWPAGISHSRPNLMRWLWSYVLAERDREGLQALSQKYMLREFLDAALELEREVESGGFLYLMVEQGVVPPICKIGRTDGSPKMRETQLNSSTSQHRRIKLVASWRVPDSVAAERHVHDHYSIRRVNERREFFQVDPDRAMMDISRLLSTFASTFARY